MMWKNWLNFKTRLKTCKISLAVSYFILCFTWAIGCLFGVAFYLRDCVGPNIKWCVFFLAIGFIIYYLFVARRINYFSSFDFKVFNISLLVNVFCSVLSTLKLHFLYALEITWEIRFLEYCGDWVIWFFLFGIAMSVVFDNPEFDKRYEEEDKKRSDKKK